MSSQNYCQNYDSNINPEMSSEFQSEGLPYVLQEVEIETSENAMISESSVSLDKKRSGVKTIASTKKTIQSSDSYNGAVRDNYAWSQTITDVDVLVKLPEHITRAKDLKVTLDTQSIKVEGKAALIKQSTEVKDQEESEWSTVFDNELTHKIRKDESMWSIIPGGYISIHLEKASERWWNALITGEPKIELNKIDCSRNLDEMGSMEQMKIEELMWNHQQKLLGKPTSDQIKMEAIMKKAWNAKGSPFEGTPYDPSMIKFN